MELARYFLSLGLVPANFVQRKCSEVDQNWFGVDPSCNMGGCASDVSQTLRDLDDKRINREQPFVAPDIGAGTPHRNMPNSATLLLIAIVLVSLSVVMRGCSRTVRSSKGSPHRVSSSPGRRGELGESAAHGLSVESPFRRAGSRNAFSALARRAQVIPSAASENGCLRRQHWAAKWTSGQQSMG